MTAEILEFKTPKKEVSWTEVSVVLCESCYHTSMTLLSDEEGYVYMHCNNCGDMVVL